MSVGIILSVASQAYAASATTGAFGTNDFAATQTNTNNGGNARFGVGHNDRAASNVRVNTINTGAAGNFDCSSDPTC